MHRETLNNIQQLIVSGKTEDAAQAILQHIQADNKNTSAERQLFEKILSLSQGYINELMHAMDFLKPKEDGKLPDALKAIQHIEGARHYGDDIVELFRGAKAVGKRVRRDQK